MLIRIGSTGQTVRNIQEMLNVAVAFQPLLELDGIFGPKTNERVVTFQKQAGLLADGIVGPMTSKALLGAVIRTLRDE